MILLNQVIELWVVALPGLWVTGYHRIMGFPPYTNSGMPKTYGLSQVMAYEGYGLRGCRLYCIGIGVVCLLCREASGRVALTSTVPLSSCAVQCK